MTIIRVGVDIAKSFFMFTALIVMIRFSGRANTLARNGWRLYASEYPPELRLALKPARPRISCKVDCCAVC